MPALSLSPSGQLLAAHTVCQEKMAVMGGGQVMYNSAAEAGQSAR